MTKAGYSLRQQLIVRTALLMTLVFVILSAGVWDYARRAADISLIGYSTALACPF